MISFYTFYFIWKGIPRQCIMTGRDGSSLRLKFTDAEIRELVGEELTLTKKRGQITFPTLDETKQTHAQAIIQAIDGVLVKPLDWRLE